MSYPCQEVLLDVLTVRWNGLCNIPEKPDEEWESFMEELCVSLAAFPVVCAKFNSLRQLHNKTTKTLRNFHAEFWTRIIFLFCLE